MYVVYGLLMISKRDMVVLISAINGEKFSLKFSISIEKKSIKET